MAPPTLAERLKPFFAPVSVVPPSRGDEAATRTLVKYLDDVAPLETEAERELREKLLLDLRRLMGEWVRSACVRRGVPEDDAPTGRLFVSGSYRLGVNQKGADIDAILVVPVYVQREDFFDESEQGLVGRLRAHAKVSQVLAIPTAKVPLIEVVWGGIELDVLFARLQGTTLPDTPDDLLDDALLARADEGTILSLNGPRVTELVVKLVPMYDTFCIVLRGLRLWAKRRGIYSNKMGFLGGVNFAILAAFACQLYPKETASRCLTLLFTLLDGWPWPSAIRLCHPYEGPAVPVAQWDPVNYVGRQDKMPIVTPAYPNTNSSYNVTAATLKVMKREFERGRAEARRVVNLGEAASVQDWAGLFQDSDFFFRYKMYVSVVALAQDAESLKKWTGFVESRLRKLVESLERAPLYDIFPYPASFDAPDVGPFAKRWFVGMCTDPYMARSFVPSAQAKAVNLEGVVVPFLFSIQSWDERIEGMSADVFILKFQDMVKGFPSFYPLGVKHAVEMHKEIQLDTRLRIEKQYTGGAGMAAAAAATEAEAAPETEGGGEAGPSGATSEELPMAKRHRRETVDLTALRLLPQDALGEAASYSADHVGLLDICNLTTPKELKVVLKDDA